MYIHPSLHGIRQIHQLASRTTLFDSQALAEITASMAGRTELWQGIVRHDPARRWYQSLVTSDLIEVWLIGWAPGQWTRPHDHGGAAGALAVAEGSLSEMVYSDSSLSGSRRRLHQTGEHIGFAADHVHRVGNDSAVNATSIHAYSRPLEMRYFGPADDAPALLPLGAMSDDSR